MYKCKVVADSITRSNDRLTTLEITYPRFIHSEIMTHRDRARNAASSRAIPWPKMMSNIKNNPVIPIRWGSEQKGMQTGGEIDDIAQAEKIWLEARDNAVKSAEQLAALGVHKSLVNRLTEPFMWITVVMTATEWKNLFRQRCHPDAEIHFQKIAYMMRDALAESVPEVKLDGEWHLPYSVPEDFELDIELVKQMCVARCARVSCLTQDGKRSVENDLKLCQRLFDGSGFGHWSPFEHVAEAMYDGYRDNSPYVGWRQYRKSFKNENEAG